MRGTRLLALAGATVFAVAGCSTADPAEPAATEGQVTAAPATPAPTGSPSPLKERVIASSALLQPDDLSGAALEPLAAGQSAHLRPARPCGARYPSDATRTAAVAMRAQVSPGAGQTPLIVLQYVGLHPGNAAAAFAEIAAAVSSCPGSLKAGQHEWRAAGTDVAGDESMLLRVSDRFEYGGSEVTTTTPVVVARVGDYITVVADLGWESASGDEEYVRQLAAKAVERLRTNG